MTTMRAAIRRQFIAGTLAAGLALTAGGLPARADAAAAQTTAITTTKGVQGSKAKAKPTSKTKMTAKTQTQLPRAGAKSAGTTNSTAAAGKLAPQQKFVLDVARMAVALPQGDPQDRLRVLQSAINVVWPVDQKLARSLANEGVRLEAELIAAGQTPAASVLATGRADCKATAQFVDQVPDADVAQAEQSLIGAVTHCSRIALEPVRTKLDAALAKGVVAPRAMMAVIEATGPKTAYSQTHFEKLFDSLPSDPNKNPSEAPNMAAMYVQMAPQVEKDVARKAGLKLLEWLGKMDPGGERNLSLNMATGVMRHALGDEGYEAALASNVMARQAAQSAGQPGEIEHPPQESVSVLDAMRAGKADQSEALRGLPSSLRARQAAALGFAAGTGADRSAADKYFDIAFAALDEVWAERAPERNAPAVVQEVSEAAAQVDAVAALGRAQRLQEPAARAIGMLAVARVVGSKAK